MIRYITICVLSLFGFLAQSAGKPSILFIPIDDLNDWIEPLGGHPQTKTPNLNRLAKRGVTFTNAHCSAPICGPSRTSFLYGVRPSTSGILNNGDVRRIAKAMADKESLPRHMKKNGYLTLNCGKIFHGSSKGHFEVDGPTGGQGPFPKKRFHMTDEGSRTKLWDWGAFPRKNELAHDYINAQWAAGKLLEKSDRPLFLAVGFYRPHVPCYAPPEWFKPFPIESVQLPPYLKNDLDDITSGGRKMLAIPAVAPSHQWMVENDKWKSCVQAYLASVAFMDHCLGVVLDTLDQSPRADNTWIIAFGDHGWHLGEKDHWAKRTLYQRSTRVPLFIAPPKSEAENWRTGDRENSPVELIHLYPTICELCGIDAPDHLEGHSMLGLLKSGERPVWPHPAITDDELGNQSSFTSDGLHTIKFSDGTVEKYDLSTDPNEWTNLAR